MQSGAKEQHKLFVESFCEIINYKFEVKLEELVKEAILDLSDILYLLNKHSRHLLYFHPQLVQDPMLRRHLEKMVKLNKEHVTQLTKDIKTGDITGPIGNVIDLCQEIGLGMRCK